MVAGVSSMQIKRSKLPNQMVRGSPHLYMRVVRDSNVPNSRQRSVLHFTDELGHEAAYFPSGENLIALTGL